MASSARLIRARPSARLECLAPRHHRRSTALFGKGYLEAGSGSLVPECLAVLLCRQTSISKYSAAHVRRKEWTVRSQRTYRSILGIGLLRKIGPLVGACLSCRGCGEGEGSNNNDDDENMEQAHSVASMNLEDQKLVNPTYRTRLCLYMSHVHVSGDDIKAQYGILEAVLPPFLVVAKVC